MRTLQQIVFWASLGLLVTAWGRLVWLLVDNPSPAQLFEFTDRRDRPLPARAAPYCRGPAVVDGVALWRVCEYRPAADQRPPVEGLVRFDAEQAQAQMRWPFPEDVHAALVGAVRLSKAALLVLLADGHLYRVGVEGDLELVGQAQGPVIGFSPVDERVEVVYADGRVVSFNGSGAQSVGRAPPPAGGPILRACLAEWADDNWYLVWLLAPEAPGPEAATVPARLLCSDLDEIPRPCGHVDLPAALVDGSGPGPHRWRGLGLQPAPGNLLMRAAGHAAWLERGAEGWRLLTPPAGAPAGARLDAESDGLLLVDQLVPLPRFEAGDRAWVRMPDGWLELRAGPAGLRVGRSGGAEAGPLVRDAWLDLRARVAPMPGGGYWLLGVYGTWLQLDDHLRRIDRLSPMQRVARLWTDFDRLAPFDDFHLELAWLKKLDLLLVLLFWPGLAIGLWWPLRRVPVARWDSRLARCLRVAAWAYLPLAAAGFWWFWRLTALV